MLSVLTSKRRSRSLAKLGTEILIFHVEYLWKYRSRWGLFTGFSSHKVQNYWLILNSRKFSVTLLAIVFHFWLFTRIYFSSLLSAVHLNLFNSFKWIIFSSYIIFGFLSWLFCISMSLFCLFLFFNFFVFVFRNCRIKCIDVVHAWL